MRKACECAAGWSDALLCLLATVELPWSSGVLVRKSCARLLAFAPAGHHVQLGIALQAGEGRQRRRTPTRHARVHDGMACLLERLSRLLRCRVRWPLVPIPTGWHRGAFSWLLPCRWART